MESVINSPSRSTHFTVHLKYYLTFRSSFVAYGMVFVFKISVHNLSIATTPLLAFSATLVLPITAYIDPNLHTSWAFMPPQFWTPIMLLLHMHMKHLFCLLHSSNLLSESVLYIMIIVLNKAKRTLYVLANWYRNFNVRYGKVLLILSKKMSLKMKMLFDNWNVFKCCIYCSVDKSCEVWCTSALLYSTM